MTTVSAERLSKIFVEVADTLVDEFDLLEFLHMLTDRAQTLADASAVGLVLADQRGELQFMAASHESARLLELFQLQTKEGPCLEAYRTGEPVAVRDLREAAGRWPRFEAAATEAGIRSVHAFPLRLRREVIGALNVFGQESGLALDDADEQIIQALADVAAIALLQERTIHRGEILTEQLQSALNSRIVIEQAKGVLAQALSIDVDEAFTLLRSYARRGGRRLGEVAQLVVTDLGSIPGLAPPHSS
jgi:GAF domain-containing protein